MKRRLIEATLDCLQDYGYHGASLSLILERAGVSRGAWRHHYSSKKELIAAAVEYLLRSVVIKPTEAVSAILSADNPLLALSDFVWETFYQGRYRDVWLEFNVACRTDAELREALTPVIEKLFGNIYQLLPLFAEPTDDDQPSADVILNLSLYLFRGMAVQSILYNNPEHFRELRKKWIEMVAPMVRLKTVDTKPE